MYDAEKAVHAEFAAMRQAFTGLWKWTDGVAKGNKGVERMDWEGVQERLIRLEAMISPVARDPPVRMQPQASLALRDAPIPSLPPEPRTVPPPAPPAGPPPEPPKVSFDTVGEHEDARHGKRTRARELLDDILKRLRNVEGMKQGFEDRFDEFENHLFLGQGEAMDGIRSWEDLEKAQDPSGRVEGIPVEAADNGAILDVTNGVHGAVIDVEMETEAAQDGDLQGMAREILLTPAKTPTTDFESLQVELKALRDEVTVMREDKERNGRELIAIVMEGMREEYAAIARKVSSINDFQYARLSRTGISGNLKSRPGLSSETDYDSESCSDGNAKWDVKADDNATKRYFVSASTVEYARPLCDDWSSVDNTKWNIESR